MFLLVSGRHVGAHLDGHQHVQVDLLSGFSQLVRFLKEQVRI